MIYFIFSINRIWFDPFLLKLAKSFAAQTILKHILTMGDKFLMIGMGLENNAKGIYSLVSDLGSIVARILFQPLEETSRALFSKNLTNPKSNLS